MVNEPKVKQIYIDECEQSIDWLIYKSYAFNRERSPHIDPSRWREIYLNQPLYEKIYQGDKNV